MLKKLGQISKKLSAQNIYVEPVWWNAMIVITYKRETDVIMHS